MLGEIEHADALGDPVQRSSYLLNVPAAGLIIVTDDDYIGAVQRFAVFRPPLPSPHRVGGCDQAKGTKVLYVPFALGNIDRLLVGYRRDQFGKAIEDSTDSRDTPLRPRVRDPYGNRQRCW
jgi:hypothetical protein